MRDLRRSRPVRSATLGLALATAVLTGCAEKQEARDTLPTTSASPTTEDLAPLGPPDMPMPAEAREQTAEGADAFTTYYVELYNHALRTLDTTFLRDLSSGCDSCDQLAEQLEATSARGQGIEGGEMRIVGRTPPYLRDDVAELVFDIAQAPISATEDGKPLEGRSYPGSESTGGGGVLRWDEERTTWVFTQWNVS